MNTRIGQQIGNYRLIQLLGQGGFAEVYLATHVHLKSPGAVKLQFGQLTAQDVQAFLGEAQTIAALKHPCIVRILDFGFEQNLPFLVMEYVPGGTLRDRHPEGTVVALTTVVSYVQPIASALAHAHTHRLIHRDVKPENMLIDTDGKILLSDFGIAVTAHSTISMKTLDRTGTVPYMAPEQIQGKPRSASDQYSLAIVVYEWLCGERPFLGNHPIEIAMKHLSEKPLPLRSKGLSARVDRVILRALAKDPQQRFPDILAFAHALEQASQPTNRNLLTTLLPVFPQKQALPPTQPAPQRQMLPPTQPAHSPASQQKRSTEVSAEEEILLTYIQSLSNETSRSEAGNTQETMLFFIRKCARFLQQSGGKERILSAFNNALTKTSSDNIYGSDARRALTTTKAEYLSLFSNYRAN
jgi:eukaryotic-like serine/threonine-protein kinase